MIKTASRKRKAIVWRQKYGGKLAQRGLVFITEITATTAKKINLKGTSMPRWRRAWRSVKGPGQAGCKA